jgi:hypothetical protein
MKPRLLPAAALVLLPTIVHAQGGADARVTITVQGATALAATGVTRFGTVDNASSRTATIDPGAPTGDQTVAFFVAQGAPNTDIRVTFNSTLDLCHESLGCAQKIVFTSNVAASAGPISNGFHMPSGGSLVRLNEQGNFFFWLGGSIQTAQNQTPGAYSAVFTMRVEAP